MSDRQVVIPAEPDDYDEDDLATAADRVDAARRKVLESDAGRRAHDALRALIDERVAARKASLAQLRKALGLTQAQVAETLGIEQAEVSKLERRTNLQLATLGRFVEATGGNLRISAVYGDVEVPLHVGDIAAAAEPPRSPSPSAGTAPPAKPASATRKATAGVKKRTAATGKGTGRSSTAGVAANRSTGGKPARKATGR